MTVIFDKQRVSKYSMTKKTYLSQYPTKYLYVDTPFDRHINYKKKQLREFFLLLKDFLEHNKPFFDKFGDIMLHKIRSVNPDNVCAINEDGFEYITDKVSIYTDRGVFEIKFHMDKELK